MELPKNLEKLTVPELKVLLKARGFPVAGKKSNLIARLKGENEEKPDKKRASTAKGPPAKKQKADASEKSSTGETDTDFTRPALKEGELKIVTWNVASLNSVLGKGFADYLKKEDPDILCLNETKCSEKKYPADKFPGYTAYYYAAKTEGYSGTALITRIKPINVSRGIGVDIHDTEGRVITAEFDNFYLVATYIPNSGEKGDDGWPKNLDKRMAWDKEFQKYLHQLDKKKPVIWCGDLNVAHKPIDLKNPSTNTKTAGYTEKERTSFGKFLETGFVDTYRHFSPDETDCYSFWSYKHGSRQRNTGWRLDYFIVSQRLMPRVTQSYIRKYVMGSDHCPICLHLKKNEK